MEDKQTKTTATPEEPDLTVGWDEEDAILLEGYIEDGDSADGDSADTAADEEANSAREGGETAPEDGKAEAEPDYKALYEELSAREAARTEAEQAEKFRARVHDLMDAEGYPQSVAVLAAREEFGGKSYPLDAAAGNAASPADTGAGGDLAGQIKTLSAKYPNVKTIPESVLTEAAAGKNLLEAYEAYASAEKDAELSRLRSQVAEYAKRDAARKRAPVRGVTGGGETGGKKDPMLDGFEADGW